MNEKTISKIADRMHELFVVNPYAIAIQEKNGLYLTNYVQYDARVLEAMILSHGSAGCYQQGFKNGLIKWVCLDYDCKDKENPDIEGLYLYLKKSVLKRLNQLNIQYLTEFSGRRGIHIWIIFDRIFEKRIGFQIINKLLENFDLDADKYELDKFPATASSRNNIVGKQVKFPLSSHQKGGQSFFFNDFVDKNVIRNDAFFQKQYRYINQYKENSLECICSKLDISLQDEKVTNDRLKKYKIIDGKNLSVEDIVNALSGIRVFREIFLRLKNGKPLKNDWFVILGTLGCLDKTGGILKSFFSQSPAYDEKTTQKNIDLWKRKYCPATLGYLYSLYNISIENELNPSDTGMDILARKLNISVKEIDIDYKNEGYVVNSLSALIDKEKNYMQINDENVVISIWNRLKQFTSYESDYIKKTLDEIKKGEVISPDPENFSLYRRKETPDKTRTLISLSALDRSLTTYVSLDLAYSLIKKSGNIEGNDESFSYKVSFLSKNDIFQNWYTAWGNYIDKIKSYIKMPFMANWGVITLDIKHFYDNIDFLTVYGLCERDLDEIQKKEFKFLISYNEKLMRKINENHSRKGVPQGPAYARIISEIFLNKILSKRNSGNINPDRYRLYRYVDDIILFYKDGEDGQSLYDDIKNLLKQNGLSLNLEKSRHYGKISSLSQEDIDIILRKEKFNYMYQKSEMNMLLSEKEKKNIFLLNDNHDFCIDDAAYVFSEKTDDLYTDNYYRQHAEKIFSSDYGRGSVFRKIYGYVFMNESVFDEFVSKKYYRYIPINSLNFKNFISSLYLHVQNKRICERLFWRLRDDYLKDVAKKKIENEEYSVVLSLIGWEKKNG